MIEVDVFWSFAIGASCACAASKQLSRTNYAFRNKYFAYTLFVLACVFSPSGSYLLLAFPGWESMFLLNRDVINKHPMLITIFNSTNSLLGVIGFYLVHKIVRNNKQNGIIYANLCWVIPYVIMFAILGFGYDRFLFPSSYNEYHKNYDQHPALFAFFTCDVFFTLLAMGVILVPMLYYPVFAWTQFSINELRHIRWFVVKALYCCIILIICGYLGFIHMYIGNDTKRQSFYNDSRIQFAGIYAPIVGFLVFMHSLFSLTLLPVFLRSAHAIQPKNSKSHRKKH